MTQRQFSHTFFCPITDQKHIYYQETMKPWHVSITFECHVMFLLHRMAVTGSKGSSLDGSVAFGKWIPLGVFKQEWKQRHIAELCIDQIYTLDLPGN